MQNREPRELQAPTLPRKGDYLEFRKGETFVVESMTFVYSDLGESPEVQVILADIPA
jgi:hypothetical protein